MNRRRWLNNLGFPPMLGFLFRRMGITFALNWQTAANNANNGFR